MTNPLIEAHCARLLEQFDSLKYELDKMQEIVVDKLNLCVNEAGLYVDGVASRVKTRDSLQGKLAKKGLKYQEIFDVTDLVGARIITFYTDDVDKIASLVDKYFDIDWANSVDKRKSHELDSFGYNSLHYICRIPKDLYHDPEHPLINQIRFEVQMRTCLQHVWATINHDIGYKTDVEIPREYLRNLLRLAGMLELADEQFSSIRTEINDYRRQVQNLVANGQFDQVPLDGDSFASYLELRPYDKLNRRIAAINQAEILPAPMDNYLKVFKLFEFKTLGDVDSLLKKYADDAYVLAVQQIGRTDIDIISSTISLQNLCCIHVIKAGGEMLGLKKVFDLLDGPSDFNEQRAILLLQDARALSIGC